MFTVFICGSALRGQPDHDNLPDEAFRGEARTTANYRLHSVKDGWHPGIFETDVDGISIPGELYQLTTAQYEFLEEKNYNRLRMPLLLTRKGWAYSWLKQAEDARKTFERAIALKDDYAPPRYALGILDYRQGRYRQAIESLTNFIALRPEGKQADKARGLILRMKKSN